MYVFFIIMFYCAYGLMSEIKNYYYYYYYTERLIFKRKYRNVHIDKSAYIQTSICNIYYICIEYNNTDIT